MFQNVPESSRSFLAKPFSSFALSPLPSAGPLLPSAFCTSAFCLLPHIAFSLIQPSLSALPYNPLFQPSLSALSFSPLFQPSLSAHFFQPSLSALSFSPPLSALFFLSVLFFFSGWRRRRAAVVRRARWSALPSESGTPRAPLRPPPPPLSPPRWTTTLPARWTAAALCR